MKNDISGGTAFIIFWIIIIIIAAIVIGLNKITQSDYGLALLIMPIIVFIAIGFYRDYRKNLNKKEQEARIKREKFNKPTVLEDSKTGLSIIFIVIIGSIILMIIYAVLHWLYPGMFPSIDVN